MFGGYLIHEAFTLAQASLYMFGGTQAALTHVHKIVFRHPVHIGDLIRLRSRIVYVTDEMPRRAVCDITCHVVKPERVSSILSNRFSFVFTLEEGQEGQRQVCLCVVCWHHPRSVALAAVLIHPPPPPPPPPPGPPAPPPPRAGPGEKRILPSTKEECMALFAAATNVLQQSTEGIARDYQYR